MKTLSLIKTTNHSIIKAINTNIFVQVLFCTLFIYPMLRGIYNLGFYPTSIFLILFLGSLFGWGGYSFARKNGMNTKLWGTFCFVTGPIGWLLMGLFQKYQLKD